MSVTSRRDFIRNSAIAATATAAGVTGLGAQEALAQAGADGIKWDKGVCRYCGTGCGVLVGVKGGRIVATLAKLLHEKGSGSRGLISICAAGGQGVVAILEAA